MVDNLNDVLPIGEKLANEHWGYVEKVLVVGREPTWDEKVQDYVVDIEPIKNMISVIEFHYKSAFIHGFKHGIEESQKNGNIN